MITQQPKLSLIEVGPGEIDLITVKGLKLLRTADVVLYDHTVNSMLVLEYAPQQAIKVFTGNKGKKTVFLEEDIPEIIVEYAQTYGHVVLLKGKSPVHISGLDPSVINYARERGLHTEYVPGVPDFTLIRHKAFIDSYFGS